MHEQIRGGDGMPCTPGNITSNLVRNRSENRIRKGKLPFFTRLGAVAFTLFVCTSAQAKSCPTGMTEWVSAHGAGGGDGADPGDHGLEGEAAKVVGNAEAGASACVRARDTL